MNEQQNYTPQNDLPLFYDNTIGTPPPPKSKQSGMAIASLVMGILTYVLTCCCFVSPILAVLAIVFAFVARSKNGGKMPGMAIAGMILGIIFWVLVLALLITTLSTGILNQLISRMGTV